MRQLSKQRRKVVVLAANVSVLAYAELLIWPHHSSGRWEWLRWVWLGFVVVLLVKVIVELAKLRKRKSEVESLHPPIRQRAAYEGGTRRLW